MQGVGIDVIAVLITCFNRKEFTRDIVAKFVEHSEAFDLYIVDGGSSDGTRDLLQELSREFPNVSLILQDDSYWAESMRVAWENAINSRNYHGYLLVNDDLQIENKRIEEFLNELRSFNDYEIRVGQCLDQQKSEVTYGGLVRKNAKSKIHFRIANSCEKIITFNANFVYVPHAVVEKIGILSAKFRHSFADIDYGLRATKYMIPIRLIRKSVGTTNYNHEWSNSISNINLSNFREILFAPKGLPINEWFIFCRRHAGPFWLTNFLYRYLRMLFK